MVPADVPTRARAPVVTHAKLPIRNPFIGSFSHAPPSSTAYCRFFNNAVTSSVEYQRQKSFKNNPYTGTFHHEPGKYSSLHGKRALDSLYSPVATPSLPTLALPPLDLGPALADVAAVAGSARACKDDDARSDTGSVSSVSVPASPAATPLSDPLTFRTCDVTLALAIQSTMASTATFTTFGRGRIQVTTFVAPL